MWFTLGAGFMAPQLIKCDSKAALTATTTFMTKKIHLNIEKRRFIQIMG